MKLLSKRPVLFGWATTAGAVPGARASHQRHHPRVPRVVIAPPVDYGRGDEARLLRGARRGPGGLGRRHQEGLPRSWPASCIPTSTRDPAAAEQFREASEAYEALSNAETRARYDRFGHAGMAGTQFHPEQFMDFSNLSDLLGAFFGDDLFGASRRPARGGDAAAAVELTLAEAAFGVTREVDVDIIGACDRCHGDGAEPGTTPATLPDVRRQRPRAARLATPRSASSCRRSTCPACRGRGARIDSPCTACRGARRAARIASRSRCRSPAASVAASGCGCAGRGHAGEAGAPRGDLYVSVGGGRRTAASSARATTSCRCSTCRSPRRRWGRA